jgi:hypothetical protein
MMFFEVCVPSGFHRKVNEICDLLGYYAAYVDNSLPTCQGNIFVPSSRVKNGTDRLSRNVGKELPRLAA